MNWGKGKPRHRTSAANWRMPLKWHRDAHLFVQCGNGHRWQAKSVDQEGHCPVCGLPDSYGARPRVFCASLADVFDEEVPDSWRDDVFELVAKCTHIDWLILTKRPEKMRDYLLGESGAGAANFEEGGCFRHVWLGVSIENQKAADERVPILLEIPARVRFLSGEPLLEEVSLVWMRHNNDWDPPTVPEGINWVIVGGESGPNARPMHPEWARSLRDQCAAAGVPFFFKQWGEWLPRDQIGTRGKMRDLRIDRGADMEWTREGKGNAGCLLDGKIHNEFPKSSSNLIGTLMVNPPSLRFKSCEPLNELKCEPDQKEAKS
jgi:protein gp37